MTGCAQSDQKATADYMKTIKAYLMIEKIDEIGQKQAAFESKYESADETQYLEAQKLQVVESLEAIDQLEMSAQSIQPKNDYVKSMHNELILGIDALRQGYEFLGEGIVTANLDEAYKLYDKSYDAFTMSEDAFTRWKTFEE
ncbi:hypothetical protein F3D3_0949 [Fusibacter sp. 3D3]|nr:hypothetical protein F3D3_0949 [Fusibacter sp. 3D3]